MSAGAPNASLYLILQGSVAVHPPGHDGRHVRFTSAACVGELSLVDGRAASTDVVAVCGPTLPSAGTAMAAPRDPSDAVVGRAAWFRAKAGGPNRVCP